MQESDIKKTKNKNLGLLVGAIAFGLAYFAVKQFLFKAPAFDKAMMQAASELNKTCPMMVDQETRLDNTAAYPENIFQYNYTLVNLAKADINIEEIKKQVEPTIVNNIKTNPDLKLYREHKTTMAYNYRDKNGVFLFKIDVTPDKYSQ